MTPKALSQKRAMNHASDQMGIPKSPHNLVAKGFGVSERTAYKWGQLVATKERIAIAEPWLSIFARSRWEYRIIGEEIVRTCGLSYLQV